MSSIAQQIARLHPIVLTMLVVVGVPISMVAASIGSTPVLRGFPMALLLGATCAWSWAIFEISSHDRVDKTRPAFAGIFAAPPLLGFVAGFANWPTNNSPAAFAIFGFLFTSLWLAAHALEKAVHPKGHPTVGRALATMLLMYFSFVGVWILRAKVIRVADRASAALSD